MTYKQEARYILIDQSKKGLDEGCTHGLKLLLPDDLLRSYSDLLPAFTSCFCMKALRWLETF